jgi:phospholipase C
MNGILSRPVFLPKWEAAAITLAILVGCTWSSAVPAANAPKTRIRHLIVVVGENHSFDNLFGAYQPAAGQTIFNLLSEGVVNRDGAPGPHFNKAQQCQAKQAPLRCCRPPTPRG